MKLSEVSPTFSSVSKKSPSDEKNNDKATFPNHAKSRARVQQ